MSPYALQRGAFAYSQKPDTDLASLLDRKFTRLIHRSRGWYLARPWVQHAFCQRVLSHESRLREATDALIQAELLQVRGLLRMQGPRPAHAAWLFALVRELSGRVLGLRHFETQIKGAWAIVQGTIAEMDTGEGKTLTATLAVACMAYAGNQVHVLTVNDYLAQRDRDELEPLYSALGLSSAMVPEGADMATRESAYQSDIVFCTGKTVTFDYLRDRIALGPRMQPLRLALDRLVSPTRAPSLLRGLHFALVDEADSVLIDEARTPLIVSQQQPDPARDAFYRQAMDVAVQLKADVDFLVPAGAQKTCVLTEPGYERLHRLCPSHGLWKVRAQREEVVMRALSALHCFVEDVDYIIRDDKVMIVDENTGRVMPDRAWEGGLQQMIELRHGLPMSPDKVTRGRISFQTFFRRYLQCAGMTGTCREVAGEMAEVYGLPVVRIQPRRPSRRQMWPARVFACLDDKWRAVAQEVARLSGCGRPVLVGTRSVRSSEQLAACLTDLGLQFAVINAKHDKQEADVVARAGQPGAITIATNMAGRGTDIKLPADVEAAGGLHVVLTEYHDTGRVDRQLIGRCARQGNQGSAQVMVSLEDELWQTVLPLIRRALQTRAVNGELSGVSRLGALALVRWMQRRVEARHSAMRQRTWVDSYRVRNQLSFTGQSE